jgi:hypothetical protein
MAPCPSHAAWLAANPNISEDWLRQKIVEGFDIHHIDGDHWNNDPDNLALIWHDDHLGKLHGLKHLRRRPGLRKATSARRPPRPGGLTPKELRAKAKSEAYLASIGER